MIMRAFFFLLIAGCMSVNSAFALENALKIKLSSGSYTDETVVRFHMNGTAGYDNGLDAAKLISSNQQVPSLFTKDQSNANLSINALPLLNGITTVQLFTRIGFNGNYTFTSLIMGAFANGTVIYLHDKQDNKWFEFANNTAVTFTLTSNQLSSPSRFELCFVAAPQVSLVNGICGGSGKATITKANVHNWSCRLDDESGEIVYQNDSVNESLEINDLAAGTYNYELRSDSVLTQRGQLTITSTQVPETNFDHSVSWDGTATIVSFSNMSVNADTYHWSFGDGDTSVEASPSHSYSRDTIYEVTLVASKDGCTSSISKSVSAINPVLSSGIKKKDASWEIVIASSENGALIQLSTSSEPYYLTVYSTEGKQVFRKQIEGNELQLIELNKSGYYIAVAQTSSGTISKNFNFVK
jgi:PKD repeat protein